MTSAVPAAPTWAALLTALLDRGHLDVADVRWAMAEIMSGEASPAQVAAFAVALRAKGETPEEVGGLAEEMLARATPLAVTRDAVDIVGTGGDRARTVNISTMAALVVAAAGTTVVKHGNRAASSACGSADLLEALGVRVDLDAAGVQRCVAGAGIGFCFAPVFHPAMRHAAAARRELGIPTVFNFLGPLSNPGRPRYQAVGAADARMAGVMAGVLAARGTTALVFRGDDGLDELTTTTTSTVWRVGGTTVRSEVFDPTRLGIPRASGADLRGADAAHNAAVARRFLAGEKGPVRDAVLLNAAAGLALTRPGGHQASLDDLVADGLVEATAAVDDGRAERLLATWVALSSA